MPGEPLRFGPFVGGLNTGSDPTAVADSELVECNNLELDIDGSLVSRPPIQQASGSTNTTHLRVIGMGIFGSTNYLIFSADGSIHAYDGTTWTVITGTTSSEKAVQYRDFVWIIPKPGSGSTGGKWSPSGGFTTVAAIPEGESAVVHKERLFVTPGDSSTSNTSRLRFSDTADLETWPASSFIDVSPGDGEKLIDVIVFNDNLMLFKHDSTYILAYDLQPSDAILREVNSVIGATTRRCVVQYENSVFVYHEGDVYEIINYDFNRINIKVPFLYDGTVPTGSTRQEEVFLSIFGDRLLVRYYNRVYVFGLKTRTWGRWSSSSPALHNFGPVLPFPENPTQSVNTLYCGGSSLEDATGNDADAIGDREIYCLRNGYDVTVDERTLTDTFDITCQMETKNFDIADSHHYKKLFWWGADVLTTRNVVGTAAPVIVGFQVTWGDLASKTWGELTTWGDPIIESNRIETDVSHTGSVKRKFVKFLKTLRFRQLSYQLELTNNGTTTEGPCRVFTITGIIRTKQVVAKGSN